MAAGSPRSDIAKYGYVEFKSKHLKSYRKRWLVLFGASWNTPARLVKYTNEKEFQHDSKGRHEYFLSDVISAEKIPGKEKGVRVRLSTEDCKEICFTCDSEVGANDWVACIQKEAAGNRDTFEASVIHSANANIQGDVALRIGDGHVAVLQAGITTLRIPLTTIRKYQMDADSVFWIETGRKSPIGEGFIHFRSDFAYCILSRLDDQARQETKRRDSTSSSTPSTSGDQVSPAPHPTNASYIPGPQPAGRTRFPSDSTSPRSRSPPQYDRQPAEYPRIPTAHSLPRLPVSDNYRGTGWRDDRDYRHEHEHGYQRELGGPKRINRKNSGLVARDPFSLPRETNAGAPYMPMANPVGRQAPVEFLEERTPYTDMKNADRGSDRRDYLTPLHVRPDARFRDDNRNS